MVQAGSLCCALQAAVKEANTVNLHTYESYLGPHIVYYYSTWLTAIATDVGSGHTRISVAVSSKSNWFGVGRYEQKTIHAFWSNLERVLKVNAPPVQAFPSDQPALSSSHEELATVTVKSTPENSDITVDSKFVGSTPSVLRLSAGDHAIRISSLGFLSWERVVTLTTGGTVVINATLEPGPQEKDDVIGESVRRGYQKHPG
jgi:hypothetical protein